MDLNLLSRPVLPGVAATETQDRVSAVLLHWRVECFVIEIAVQIRSRNYLHLAWKISHVPLLKLSNRLFLRPKVLFSALDLLCQEGSRIL